MPRVLVDTDILIDYLRGQPNAVRFVTGHGDDIIVSALSVAELHDGVRGDAEGRESATAVAVDAALKPLNVRHHPMFEGLEPAYRK